MVRAAVLGSESGEHRSTADFALLDGTACSAGGGCPDFSAGAAPLRFGLLVVITSYPAEAAAYGIDSWQLRIWRR
jgi:hypothetical protein